MEVLHHDLSEQIVLGHQAALPSPLLPCRLSFCCHSCVSAVTAVPLMAITTVIVIITTAAASLLVRFIDFSVAVAVVR
jgi:hypothetical protein